MNTRKALLILCCLLLALVVLTTAPAGKGVQHMAIDFTGSQQVNFGDVTAVNGLTTISFVGWIYPTSDAATQTHVIADKETATSGWSVQRCISTVGNAKSLRFVAGWSTTIGSWTTPVNSVLANTLYHFAITYDASSTANNPVIYLNGVAQVLTKGSTPAGVWGNNSGSNLTLSLAGAFPYIGRLYSFDVYNYVMGVSEVQDAYNSRKFIPSRRGLVFSPSLVGSAGVQNFDGASLAAGNTFVDQVNGVYGTPSGNPTGLGDTILTYGPD